MIRLKVSVVCYHLFLNKICHNYRNFGNYLTWHNKIHASVIQKTPVKVKSILPVFCFILF